MDREEAFKLGYRAWDREKWLGSPPWKPDDPKLIAWEAAHGHDCRLKCYREFGCSVAEHYVSDEEVERMAALIIYIRNPTWPKRWGWTEWMRKDETRAEARELLEKALNPE